MSVVINTNSAATVASNNLAASNTMLQRSLNRLSSGSKIVNPSDDAGGLAVSMKLSAAATRSGAAAINIGNATSMLQTQDGVLKVAGKVLDRLGELWTLFQDPTKNASDLSNYDAEFTALQSELTSLTSEKFNGVDLFGSGDLTVNVSEDGGQSVALEGRDLSSTSGGVGTLCETLESRVRNLDYKTIRYRGHRDLIAFLMNELRLNHRRDLLKDIFENAIPITPQDVVLIFCTVTGKKDGYLTQITDARKIYADTVHGERWSAIQITTAAGICAAVDLHATHNAFERGFVRQEQISLPDFLANRFGRYYVTDNEAITIKPALPTRAAS